ncbi:MAG: PSD1 and planctomycete cytochrome C domain-containing protein [Akkermansiaceae bacterium]|nr:PSD1 and planctomycete cytochrome C domain-containing protein [Akkermansiaceae bacterium]
MTKTAIWGISLATVMVFASRVQAVDFEKDVWPILEETCLDCHGPEKQKSEFRVDQRVSLLKGGGSGIAALVPGKPERSYLIEVIKGIDPEMIMPQKGDPLDREDIAILEEWIKEGAEWPGQMDVVVDEGTDHWSFQEVIRPEVPGKGGNPIDSFLMKALAGVDLTASGSADAKSLIRRVSIILTGLPPTPERVEKFESDSLEDVDGAYTELVDELLASDHFGERWAQHWLDVIRWAETNGSEANLYRKGSWIYRDYVIRAFNEDLPYDQFVQEQLAGDQMGVGEATGFLVAGSHVPAATVGREPTAIRQARADRMDEIMQTVAASMLGVTVGCARCHNHKFDPITITDYYALTAVFQGVEFGGRHPEFAEDHPRRLRAKELQAEMFKERSLLRDGAGQWGEDWGGFDQFQFPATTTKVLKVDFDWPLIRLDELQVYGPKKPGKNLALASAGTRLEVDPEMGDKGNPVSNANDGEFGTMIWKSKAPKGSQQKPWVEIHFSRPQEVSSFRLSLNRDYFFETDYLEQKKKEFPDYRISALQEDGSWVELGGTKKAEKLMSQSADLQAASKRLQGHIAKYGEEGPRHSFVGKFGKPETTHVLHRGSPENPRDEVAPAGFAVIGGDLGLDSSTPEAVRRKKFAEWVVRPEHPLTARVMVNRIWHHVFGEGIVPTAADFGRAGAMPTHPELLDWLAAEFVEPTASDAKPWSMKGMIRLLVMSDAFRRSSEPNSAGINADAGSRLLWRFPPQRIEAEAIRDGVLQASGKLDRSIGGRSYRIHNVKKTYAQWQVVDNHGEETWRRMIYQERMRRVDDQIFTAFDFPDCGQVRAKRPVSTTPLQALNLLNSEFVVEQSDLVAARAVEEVFGAGTEDAVRRCFELLLTRQPSGAELEACTRIANSNGLHIVCRGLINSNEFSFLP